MAAAILTGSVMQGCATAYKSIRSSGLNLIPATFSTKRDNFITFTIRSKTSSHKRSPLIEFERKLLTPPNTKGNAHLWPIRHEKFFR